MRMDPEVSKTLQVVANVLSWPLELVFQILFLKTHFSCKTPRALAGFGIAVSYLLASFYRDRDVSKLFTEGKSSVVLHSCGPHEFYQQPSLQDISSGVSDIIIMKTFNYFLSSYSENHSWDCKFDQETMGWRSRTFVENLPLLFYKVVKVENCLLNT